MAALPFEGESLTAVETRRARELWFNNRLILTVMTGFIPPIARAGVTSGISMNRLCQAVRGAIMPLEGVIRCVVVQMLRT